MNFDLHQSFRELNLAELPGPSFNGGTLTFVELQHIERPIDSNEDLRGILENTSDNQALFIPRRFIGEDFMMSALSDAEFVRPDSIRDPFSHWNQVGGESAGNAIPHVHRPSTCLLAPFATSSSTAFFDRQLVKDEMVMAVAEKSLPPWFRARLARTLRVDATAVAENLEERDEAKLEVCQEFQSRVRARGGMYQVNLDTGGYGIVTFPGEVLHGRNVLNELDRAEPTIWRYLKPGVAGLANQK